MTFINEVVPFASLPAYPSFLENLRFQIVGLAIVLAALGFMALVFSIIGRFFKHWGDRKSPPGIGAISVPPEASAQGVAPLGLYTSFPIFPFPCFWLHLTKSFPGQCKVYHSLQANPHGFWTWRAVTLAV